MIRLRMSRPSSSAPRRCRAPGGSQAADRSTRSGSYGASTGASRATTTAASTTAPPAAAARLRTNLDTSPRRRDTGDDKTDGTASGIGTRASVVVADTRIEDRVGDVHKQIRGHEDDGEEQDRRLNERIVAKRHRID